MRDGAATVGEPRERFRYTNASRRFLASFSFSRAFTRSSSSSSSSSSRSLRLAGRPDLSGSAGLVALSSIIPSCSAFATVDSRYVLAESAALASSSADGRGSSSVVSEDCAGVNDVIRVGPSVALVVVVVVVVVLASSSSRTSVVFATTVSADSRRRLDPSRSGARVDAFEPVVRHTRARARSRTRTSSRARAAR